MSPLSNFDKQFFENNAITKIGDLENLLSSNIRGNVNILDASDVMQSLGNGLPLYSTDDEGALRVINSATDLFDEYGVHAHTVGLSSTGVVQFYISSEDGKLYGSVNMDQLKWLYEHQATANSETRAFRIGMRDNGTTPEGVIEYYEPTTPITIPNYDFASLDMTGFTQVQQGLIASALGTLSTAFSVFALAVIGSDVYAGGGGFTTSSVWKWNGSSWAAYGTLSTAFTVRALVVIGSDIYAGGSSFTTSSVWKSTAGGAWAAYGTLGTAFVLNTLAVIGSDIYAGGSSFTTSSVWKSTAGGAWAAYGTLAPAYNVVTLAVIGSDIYAGGAAFATSGVWKSASGGAWAAYGTLATGVTCQSLAVIGSDIYAGGSYATSSVWKSTAGGAWAAYGALSGSAYRLAVIGSDLYVGFTPTPSTSSIWRCVDGGEWEAYLTLNTAFQVYGLAVVGNTLYAGMQAFGSVTSTVWSLTQTSHVWQATPGYATLVATDGTPEIRNSARFAVTAGTLVEFAAASYAAVVAGTATITVQVKFYTAITGGTLVSTETLFTRVTTDTTFFSEFTKIVTVPATATHAIFVAKCTSTGTQVTVKFDDFAASIKSILRLVFNDTSLQVVKSTKTFDLLGSQRVYASSIKTVISTVGETTVFSISVPANFFTDTNGGHLRWKVNTYFDTNGTGRTLTARYKIGSTTISQNTAMLANTLYVVVIEGTLSRNASNNQDAWMYQTSSVSGAAGSPTTNYAKPAETDTAAITVALTLQLGGSVDLGFFNSVSVEAIYDGDLW